MADTPAPPTDAQRFIARLNALDHLPTWAEAASLGVQLVDLSREEFAIRDALADLEASQPRLRRRRRPRPRGRHRCRRRRPP